MSGESDIHSYYQRKWYNTPMIKLDDNLLTELGLGALPKEEKTAFLKHMYETLEMRVGTRLAEKMSDAQMAEFEQFINGNDEQGAFHWLESNFPNYKDVVAEEFGKLKDEIRPLATQIVATSHAQQSQQQAQQPQLSEAQPQAQPPQPTAPQYQTQPAAAPTPTPPAGAYQPPAGQMPTQPQPAAAAPDFQSPQPPASAQPAPPQPPQFSQPASQPPAAPQQPAFTPPAQPQQGMPPQYPQPVPPLPYTPPQPDQQ